jgi:glycosyltransferase involved in cell wall biosynthesis
MSTRNRAPHLGGSLPTILAAAGAAAVPTEVVVIDNGSTDATPAVLAEFAAAHEVMSVVRDEVAGKSGATNRGLDRVRGEVVVFTDDDVRVPLSWVTDMAEPILAGRADAVAGRVHLGPELDRPWLSANLRTLLAELLDVSGP